MKSNCGGQPALQGTDVFKLDQGLEAVPEIRALLVHQSRALCQGHLRLCWFSKADPCETFGISIESIKSQSGFLSVLLSRPLLFIKTGHFSAAFREGSHRAKQLTA